MLTFMSSVSLLLYLEQCVYMYKKLPYPKKTTIIWINGAAPVSISASFDVTIILKTIEIKLLSILKTS